ncbi:MAG: hypothetical protein IKK64_03170 [Bacteroidales bacterium]|nr:hypothetical protein [Bacteroidales bacterium]
MKKQVIILILLISATAVSSQNIIERSIRRSIDAAKDVVGVFTPAEPAPTKLTKGFPGSATPSSPGATQNPGVPIVESILGLLGLGGIYTWRLIKKKK